MERILMDVSLERL